MLFSYLFGYFCFWFAVCYYFSNYQLINACAVFIVRVFFLCSRCSWFSLLLVRQAQRRLCAALPPKGQRGKCPRPISLHPVVSREHKFFSPSKLVTAKTCENLSLCFFPIRKKALGRAHGVKIAPVSEHRDWGYRGKAPNLLLSIEKHFSRQGENLCFRRRSCPLKEK